MKTAELTAVSDPQRIDIIWDQVYLPAFEPIRAKAAQRHVMFWEEYLSVMTDRNVRKYVTETDDGHPVGLGLITNDLTAVPLIEPEYFEARYPKLYAERRIWYVILVCATPGNRDVYPDLLTTMDPLVEESRGIAVLDFCGYNILDRRLDRAAQVILSRHLGRHIGYKALDSQTYMAYDLTGGRP